MSKLQFSFPRLFYLESHRNERRGYIYADDLLNPSTWKDVMGEFDPFITEYIANRLHTGPTPDLRLTEVKGRQGIETYQTMVGDMISHYVHILLGTIIINQYEHYGPDGPQTANKSSSVTASDQLVRAVAELTTDVADTRDMLNGNIRETVSPVKVEFHEKYLLGEENPDNFLVSRNPNLSNFQILPEMIGVDVARMSASSGTAEKYPLEFTSASLIGWEYTSPQERSLGCPGDMASVLSDIIWLTMRKNFSADGGFRDGDTKSSNVRYLFSKVAPYYDALITSNLIGTLENYNEDFGDITNIDNRNPVVIGVKDNFSRVPDIYGLWCIYRTTRTPFYDRQAVEVSSQNIPLDTFFPYDISVRGNALILTGKVGSTDEKVNMEGIKKAIMDNLRRATKLSGFTKVSNFEVAVTEEKSVTASSLATKSLDRLYKKLESLSDNFWKNLISGVLGNIGMNLLVASQIDWEKLSQNIGEQIAVGGLGRPMTFSGVSIDRNADYKQFTVMAANSYITLQSLLRSSLGTTLGIAMGGTSLQGDQEISVQRFNEQVLYPGDASVMESLSSYLDLLNSDLNTIGSQLQRGLEFMARKYWTRDVRKWLEVIFQIFKFREPGTTGDLPVSFKFSQLERIIKILYTKQISTMRDYLQKSAVMERRITQGKGVPDPSIERQMKMVTLFASSAICYLKNQIVMIYYLLRRIQGSDLITAPRSGYNPQSFQTALRTMKITLETWFKTQTGDLLKNVTNPQAIRAIQSFSQQSCAGVMSEISSPQVAQRHLDDEKMNKIIADPRFWLLAISGLKGMDPSTVGKAPNLLKKVFIPLYEDVNNKRKYWLFDLVPFLIKGSFTGTFGGKSKPQWYSADDLVSSKEFTSSDQGYIIMTNMSSQLAKPDNWNAVSVNWFKNLVSRASQGNAKRKMWIIRFSIYLMLHDETIYTKLIKTSGVTLGSNDVDTIIAQGKTLSKMRTALVSIQQMTEAEKADRYSSSGGYYVNLISREMLDNDLNNAKLLFSSQA